MRRFLIASLFVCAWLPGQAFGYGYAEAEDPAVVLFKSALVAAKNENWVKVTRLAGKGIMSFKGHPIDADKLDPRFKAAVEAKNISNIAELFANLVYISMQNKFHANIEDQLKSYKISKARLFMARKSYVDVLGGNMKKQDSKRDESILKEFDNALAALGSPGLFGVGKKEPDVKQYNKAINTIEGSIEKTFPSFK